MAPLHGDLTCRVAIQTATLAWTQREGVDEKVLEDATRRRTAIVRLAPETSLPVSDDGGCLDIFVLDGELRIDRVFHRAGAYLHEPTGARRLVSDRGCTLFVKQRPARRRARHAVDTRMVVFEPSHTPGLSSAPLHDDLDGKVVLLRFDPKTVIGHHHHDGGEEFFVLAGALRDELGSYTAHDWVRQPAGSSHTVESATGCTFLTFAHHLG